MDKPIGVHVVPEMQPRDHHCLLCTAVQFVTDAVFLKDLQGRYLLLNSASAKLAGRPAADILQWDDFKIFPPETAAKMRELDEGIITSGEPRTFEETIPVDGEPRVYLTTKSPYRDESGAIIGLIGISRDISSRKKEERAVTRNEGHLRKVLDNLFALVGVLTPDGIVTEMNLAAIDAAGVRTKDVIGKPFDQTYWWVHSPSEQIKVRAAIVRAARGEVTRYDAPSRLAKDREAIFDFMLAPMFDKDGIVTHLVPSAIDVTDTRKAEKARRESEQRLSLAMQIAGLATWDIDLRTNKNVWSEQHFHLLGCALPSTGGAEASLELWQARLHTDDAQRVIQAMESAKRNRTPFVPEYRIIRADNGQTAWLSVNGRYLYEGELPVRFVGVVQDITERRQAEDLAKVQHEELAHLARLVTIGEMASGLAHELNQPLNAILNYAVSAVTVLSLSADVSGTKEKVLGWLGDLELQTHRAGEIIDRLRSFVRKRTPHSIPIDVLGLVQYAVNLMAAETRLQSVWLRLDIPSTLPDVLADPVQIGQVLVNLLRNAIEAMATIEPARRVIVVSAAVAEDGAAVRVSVTDSGIGISPQEKERIFESFFTTKPSGLGVGLTISRSIVESHGGQLDCISNPDGGTICHFTLPTVAANSSPEPNHAS